jgi:hypothetical protein
VKFDLLLVRLVSFLAVGLIIVCCYFRGSV